MTTHRYIFAALLAIHAGMLALVRGNVIPGWTVYLTIGASVIAGFLTLTGDDDGDSELPSTPISTKAEKIIGTHGPLGVLCCGALALTACSWLSSPQGPQGVGLIAKDAVCVWSHDTETVAEILRDCNLVADAVTEVQQILASAHANEARAAHAACFPNDAGVLGK